jgi:hypothetical protein
MAEAGCTPHEIAAVTGHASLKEVTPYTQGVDRKRLAAAAMANMATRTEHQQKCQTSTDGLTKPDESSGNSVK